MDVNKLAMLKAILPSKTVISTGAIKNELNVSGEEAEEMLSSLIQEGAVEPFTIDGRNYPVKK